jgi:hypothetical protein
MQRGNGGDCEAPRVLIRSEATYGSRLYSILLQPDGEDPRNGLRDGLVRARMDFVTVNRTPVLTLWASVVAERLGFDPDEALTLGKAVVTAQPQTQPFGFFTPSPEAVRKERAKKAKTTGMLRVALLGRVVPVVRTDFDLRAMDKRSRSRWRRLSCKSTFSRCSGKA